MKTLLNSTWIKAGLIAALALVVAFVSLGFAPSLAQAQTSGPHESLGCRTRPTKPGGEWRAAQSRPRKSLRP